MRMSIIGPMRVVGGATVHRVKPSVNCYLTRIIIPDVEMMKLKAPLDVMISVNGMNVDSRASRSMFASSAIPAAAGDDLMFTFSEPIEYFAVTVHVLEDTDLCSMDEFKRWIANRPNKQRSAS